jgi:hypothetical protein
LQLWLLLLFLHPVLVLVEVVLLLRLQLLHQLQATSVAAVTAAVEQARSSACLGRRHQQAWQRSSLAAGRLLQQQ